MKRSYGKSIFYGGLFAFWIMCFYFGIGVLSTIFQGGDAVAFAGQSIVVGFVLWFFFSMISYDVEGWLIERNKPREVDEHKDSDGQNKDRY